MSGGYVLIAGILWYIFLLQKVNVSGLTPKKGAFIFIIPYLLLQMLVKGLELSAWNAPLIPNLINPVTILTILIQFAVSFAIFYKTSEDDSATSYVVLGGVGIAMIFFALPITIQKILGF